MLCDPTGSPELLMHVFMKYERNQQYSYGAQMQKIKEELLLRATNKPLSHRMTEQWLAANMSLN